MPEAGYLGNIAVDNLVCIIHYQVIQLPVGDLLKCPSPSGELHGILSWTHISDPLLPRFLFLLNVNPRFLLFLFTSVPPVLLCPHWLLRKRCFTEHSGGDDEGRSCVGAACGCGVRRTCCCLKVRIVVWWLVLGFQQRVEVEAPDVIPVYDDQQDHKQRAQDEAHLETPPCSHGYSRSTVVIGEAKRKWLSPLHDGCLLSRKDTLPACHLQLKETGSTTKDLCSSLLQNNWMLLNTGVVAAPTDNLQ